MANGLNMQPDERHSKLYAFFNDHNNSLPVTVMGEQLGSIMRVQEFYTARHYTMAWGDQHTYSDEAYALIKVLENAEMQGYDTDRYHLEILQDALLGYSDLYTIEPSQRVLIDLLFSDAYLTYTLYLHASCIDPKIFFPKWEQISSTNLTHILQAALDMQDIEGSVAIVKHTNPDFLRLQKAKSSYQSLKDKGGWAKIKERFVVKKMDRGEEVRLIRQRLDAEALLEYSNELNATLFDSTLEEAIRQFQFHHGLKADGIVGPNTISMMNIPVENKIRRIDINLERMKWLLPYQQERYILVNIPDFTLKLIEHNETVLSMKAIVGKKERPTPILSAKLSYLVINPYWKVPETVIKEDILPALRKSPSFLKQKNMKVYLDWNGTQEVNASSVKWSDVKAGRHPYMFRQEPGANNALGYIKFVMPNRQDIYIHDTPYQALFKRASRMYSSGCIRVEKPFELAKELLKENPEWTYRNLLNQIIKAKRKEIILDKKVPVYITYQTAWADQNGTVHFRDDIYGYDEMMAPFQCTKSSPYFTR